MPIGYRVPVLPIDNSHLLRASCCSAPSLQKLLAHPKARVSTLISTMHRVFRHNSRGAPIHKVRLKRLGRSLRPVVIFVIAYVVNRFGAWYKNILFIEEPSNEKTRARTPCTGATQDLASLLCHQNHYFFFAS